MLEHLGTFALTALFISMVPGQGLAMVLRQALISGPGAARLSVLGNSTGLVIWSIASAFGLSAVFQTSVVAFEILKWAGVAYLVFIAIQTLWSLRSTNHKFDFESGEIQSAGQAFRVGFITNITNAKAMVFALAFLPQYVPTGTNLTVGVLTFGMVWALISMSWYMSVIAGVKQAHAWLQRPKVRRGLTAVSGIGILILAFGLIINPAQ